MHVNVHYAVGVIFASITAFFIPQLPLIDYLIIVAGGFIVDFDFLLSRFTKEENHRNFITHSLYPPSIIIIIGIISAVIFNYQILWIAALAYFSHIALDCIDWGVNLFQTHKTYGLFLLVSKDDLNFHSDINSMIRKNLEKDPHYFTRVYFNNPIIVTIEIIISITGFGLLFLFSPEFWYVYIGFFITLEYHLYYKRKADKDQ